MSVATIMNAFNRYKIGIVSNNPLKIFLGVNSAIV